VRAPNDWKQMWSGIVTPLIHAPTVGKMPPPRKRGRPPHLPRKNRKTGRVEQRTICPECGGRIKSRRGTVLLHSH
jgi:hypothetical protein